MAAASGSSHRFRPWSYLPTELLSVMLQRLNRVRLRAVCRMWRSSKRIHAPLLPWLALPDGTFLSVPDAAVHRLCGVPDDVSCRLSTGGALFLVHGDGSRSLTSPLSALTTPPLPEPRDSYRASSIRKVVVSDHLVGVLSHYVFVYTRGGREASMARSTMKMEALEWAPPPGYAHNATRDIALSKGKLSLTYDDELYVLEASDLHITAACCIRKIPRVKVGYVQRWFNPYATDEFIQQDYLVVSGDRLLWVKRKINVPPLLPAGHGIKTRTYLFDVFEAADLGGGGCGRWRKVDTLMGHALFVSQGCSESVSPVAGDVSTQVRQDCIYFASDDSTTYMDSPPERIRVSSFHDSGVYNMRGRTLAPLPLETSAASVMVARDGPWPPTRLFPET